VRSDLNGMQLTAGDPLLTGIRRPSYAVTGPGNLALPGQRGLASQLTDCVGGITPRQGSYLAVVNSASEIGCSFRAGGAIR
jgi:hypothetical protein